MSQEDLSLLLAVLGGTWLLASWIGRRTGDAARDVWLMFGLGGGTLAAAVPLYLMG